MRALFNLATAPARIAALTLLAALACASGGDHRRDYRSVGRRAAAARSDLVFGLSRDAAIDAIGRSEVEPPWKNKLGLGPAVISNPFDSETYTSQLGEEYEVVRFFVKASGDSRCPFVQGELQLEPLIFVDGELVGWKWSYLADVLDRRLTEKETGWEFGAFCDGRRAGPTGADAPEPATPQADPPDAD